MHPIHPMVVHSPIALPLTSCLFEVLALRWRGEPFREISLSLLVVGVLAAGAALITGHVAEEAVERSGIPKQAIDIHEQRGFATFWLFLVLLRLQPAMRWGWMREQPKLTLAAELGGSVLAASYFGRDLVSRFGAGALPR